jgi:hypothetical protein
MRAVVFSVMGLIAGAVVPVFAGPPGDDPRVVELAREVADKGWIVYGARSPQGDWDLYVCRPDGSHVRNISNTPQYNEAAPRFSFDGKRLLYRRLPRDATIHHDQWGFQGELVIARADGSDPKPFGGEGEYPWAAWSPDDTQLSCLTKQGILIVDVATKKTVRKMPRKGMYQQLVFSLDGKWFCGVTSHLGEKWTVARMNVETAEINAVNSFQNCTPDWLPDSQRVVFSHRPGNQEGYGYTQLWLANGDGSDCHLVYGQDGFHVYGGAASPDGTYLLFTECPEDGGGSEKAGAPMALMRLADAPTIRGPSPALRKLHPDTKDGPVLQLPIGWEPHWTYAEVVRGRSASAAAESGKPQRDEPKGGSR